MRRLIARPFVKLHHARAPGELVRRRGGAARARRPPIARRRFEKLIWRQWAARAPRGPEYKWRPARLVRTDIVNLVRQSSKQSKLAVASRCARPPAWAPLVQRCRTRARGQRGAAPIDYATGQRATSRARAL